MTKYYPDSGGDEPRPPAFTIVMASLLSEYRHGARDRVTKFHRAVATVLLQEHTDWELFIIADGCRMTMDEAGKYDDPRITCRMVAKQPHLSGGVRNFGIKHARHENIVYLDTDDFFGKGHLSFIASHLKGRDWVYFDDYVYNTRRKHWDGFKVNINRRFYHGTSNICHRRDLDAWWLTQGYLHDSHFISELKRRSPNHAYIGQAEYYVCHIPQKYDI